MQSSLASLWKYNASPYASERQLSMELRRVSSSHWSEPQNAALTAVFQMCRVRAFDKLPWVARRFLLIRSGERAL